MKTTMFKLDELLTPVLPSPVSAPTELRNAEKEAVIDLMSTHASINQYYSDPQVFFKDLASRAELPGREALTWQGSAPVVARQLLETATFTEYPVGHERARQKTLGWLLAAFAKYPMPPSSQDKLIALVLVHNLIDEPEKLEELRRRVPNPTEVLLNDRAEV